MKPDLDKPKPLVISKQHARRFILDHHFLLPPKVLLTDEILPKLFSRLGCIQFDTINVVGRNADLVLQSRVKNYKPEILEKMLYKDRVLLDGWDKVASIYSAADWPFFERHRLHMGNNRHNRSNEASKATNKILEMIDIDGALSSLDFKDNKKTDWSWGPTSVARAALEILYAEGKLGIRHRVNTRRHFDLIERLVPDSILSIPDPNSTDEEYQEWHLLRRIGGLGIASPKSGEQWWGIYGGGKVSERNKILKRLIQKGLIQVVTIQSLEGQEFYLRSKDLPRLENMSENQNPTDAAFIAPLDNLLWNRKLINDVFDFKYTWEVYKPKEIREYGYYVLPVLFGDQFIARADMKFERKTHTLNLINWWWESDIDQYPGSPAAIENCIADFLHYLDAESFVLSSEVLQMPEIVKAFRSLT